jgi:hypothetical protein
MLQENYLNIFPLFFVLTYLSEISDHGDCSVTAK